MGEFAPVSRTLAGKGGDGGGRLAVGRRTSHDDDLVFHPPRLESLVSKWWADCETRNADEDEHAHLSPKSPAILRTLGMSSKVPGSGIGAESSLLSGCCLIFGSAGMLNTIALQEV